MVDLWSWQEAWQPGSWSFTMCLPCVLRLLLMVDGRSLVLARSLAAWYCLPCVFSSSHLPSVSSCSVPSKDTTSSLLFHRSVLPHGVMSLFTSRWCNVSFRNLYFLMIDSRTWRFWFNLFKFQPFKCKNWREVSVSYLMQLQTHFHVESVSMFTVITRW